MRANGPVAAGLLPRPVIVTRSSTSKPCPDEVPVACLRPCADPPNSIVLVGSIAAEAALPQSGRPADSPFSLLEHARNAGITIRHDQGRRAERRIALAGSSDANFPADVGGRPGDRISPNAARPPKSNLRPGWLRAVRSCPGRCGRHWQGRDQWKGGYVSCSGITNVFAFEDTHRTGARATIADTSHPTNDRRCRATSFPSLDRDTGPAVFP